MSAQHNDNNGPTHDQRSRLDEIAETLAASLARLDRTLDEAIAEHLGSEAAE
jgi:hypothetical protein